MDSEPRLLTAHAVDRVVDFRADEPFADPERERDTGHAAGAVIVHVRRIPEPTAIRHEAGRRSSTGPNGEGHV